MDTFSDAKYGKDDMLRYFEKHPAELSYVTALEYGLEMNLFELLININN
jgi:hypothetical protein